MSERTHFLHALRFLTIAPLGAAPALAPDWLARAAKYFPLVGLLVGLVAAAMLLAADQFWAGYLPALLAIAIGAAVTGALHEDGLADSADGLLGGRSRETRLAIMKDSRVGTYGVLALGLTVAMRVGALAALTPMVAAAALVAVHAGSRCAAVAVMASMSYAGDPAVRKISAEDRPRAAELALALAFALAGSVPLALLSLPAAIAAAAAGAILVLLLARLSARLIGGYTGDVLGAAEQLFQIGFMMALAAVSA